MSPCGVRLLLPDTCASMRRIIADALVKVHSFVTRLLHICAISPPPNAGNKTMRLNRFKPSSSERRRQALATAISSSCGCKHHVESPVSAKSMPQASPQGHLPDGEDMFQRYLEGQPPDRIEHFWRRAHGSASATAPTRLSRGWSAGWKWPAGTSKGARPPGACASRRAGE